MSFCATKILIYLFKNKSAFTISSEIGSGREKASTRKTGHTRTGIELLIGTKARFSSRTIPY
jgi:hypothetical protein